MHEPFRHGNILILACIINALLSVIMWWDGKSKCVGKHTHTHKLTCVYPCRFQGVERSKGSWGRLTPQCSPPQRSFTGVCLFKTTYTIGQLKQLTLVRVIGLLLFHLRVCLFQEVHTIAKLDCTLVCAHRPVLCLKLLLMNCICTVTLT